jgi:hypothetical protein
MPSGLSLTRFVPPVLAVIAAGTLAIAAPAAALDRKKERREEAPATLSTPAALAVVSLKDQRISLYDARGNAVRARISSGQTGYETPVGVFSILQKEEEHYSNLYDDASMPFMQRITWSGVALHGGALPGYPASHGCVRLPHDFARRIFSQTKLGMRVVISKDDIAPVEIAHHLLFRPEAISDVAVATPAAYEPTERDDERVTIQDPDVRNWPARQALLETLKDVAKLKAQEAQVAVSQWEGLKAKLKSYAAELALIAKRDRAAEVKRKAETRLTKAVKALAEASSPRAQKRAEKEKSEAASALASADVKLAEAAKAAEGAEKVVAKIKEEISAAEATKTAAVAAAVEAKRKTLPISVFVSRKSQKLYVRQGNEPVFDSPVTVADPDQPIGSHIFTALDYANDGNDVRWNVVTISRRTYGEISDDDFEYRPRDYKRSEKANYAPPLTNVKTAAAALERISIPADVRARISQYVWPGSSLIISDEEQSKETGKATDFIIVASDEPQGALAKRKRQPPPSYYFDYYDDGYYFSYRPYRPNYRYDRRRPSGPKGLFSWW